MLRRGAIAAVAIGAIGAAVAVYGVRGEGESESAVGSEGESESEGERESEGQGAVEGERESESESERESESDSEGESESASPSERTLARMAALRQDVHLLEIQRLDARERGDHEAEGRLDAEIAAARAEHDRLRASLRAPEGI